jgi:hypothetical protein
MSIQFFYNRENYITAIFNSGLCSYRKDSIYDLDIQGQLVTNSANLEVAKIQVYRIK